jgi:hypothetical protein
MVRIRATEDAEIDIPEGSTDRGHGRGQAPHGNPSLPPLRSPVSIEQLLATQKELMIMLVKNEARHGVECPQHHRHQNMNMSYSDFLATHPPIFSGAKDLLEADDWLRTTESKFGLLHCTEYQKMLYVTQ